MKVVINYSHTKYTLLKSNWIGNICEDVGNQVAKKCGDGYKVTTQRGKNRYHTRVETTTENALQDNLKNNTLLKAIGL